MIPNGESVKYLGNNQVIDGVTWIEVSTKDGTIGWMVQTVFAVEKERCVAATSSWGPISPVRSKP